MLRCRSWRMDGDMGRKGSNVYRIVYLLSVMAATPSQTCRKYAVQPGMVARRALPAKPVSGYTWNVRQSMCFAPGPASFPSWGFLPQGRCKFPGMRPLPFFLECDMARITVEDCLQVVGNRFELVLMATKRARQLANGAEPLLEVENDKPTVLALRGIADKSIDEATIDAIDRAEREQAEREALEWAAAEVDDDLAKAGEE